ncbi:MAG: rhodanese-like domain-containing protein [Pseudanabaenaceae cyanobacterium bins.68]|nr:rhodanese-like domain-containing protein [Pseudanabaenaceae cyanobacterium bins.68]
MSHPEKFQNLADSAKAQITEITIEELTPLISEGQPLLIDVREESEWNLSHAAGATHLSRGVIELKIEAIAPALDTPIVCYCGGGNRSALVAENLQKMGYTNVKSLIGGFKAWQKADLPVTNSQDQREARASITLRIAEEYRQEPVISRLVSEYGLTINISAAILGENTNSDGWFKLDLVGSQAQIQSALVYLNDLGLEIWSKENHDEGW